MTMQINKRELLGKPALSAGVAVSALALLSQRTPADTPFVSFPFATAGASAPRTMPDRLGEIKNVKDFGAVGDGTTDDTVAIQTTVDWTTSAARGVIFFPPGTYRVTAPITFNYDGDFSIVFQGAGRLSSLTGNFAGYILDRSTTNPTTGVRVIEHLDIRNSNPAGGGVRMLGTVGGVIRNCQVAALTGINLSGGSGVCTIQNVVLQGWGAAGSIGVLAGGNVLMTACDVTGWDHGVRACKIGLSITGCRFEVNNVGLMLGMGPNGASSQATAFFMAGCSMEANQIGIFFNAATAGHVAGVSIGGGVSMSAGLDFRVGHGILIAGVAVSGPYISAAIDARGASGVTFIGCPLNNTSTGVQLLQPANKAQITWL
jgi:hypothetical protein